MPNRHRVIDCDQMVMKKHCYWPIISDLTNVLSHKAVVEKFFTDPLLLSLWTKFLSYFMSKFRVWVYGEWFGLCVGGV